MKQPVAYQGRQYDSQQSLADELGIKRTQLRWRMENWPEEDWGKIPDSKKSITYQGREFETQISLAKELGIDRTLLDWRMKNWPENDWAKKPDPSIRSSCREIIYKNQKYTSIAKLARKLGIGKETLTKRIDKGWPEEKWDLPGYSKDIEYKGKTYESRWQLALALANGDKNKAHPIKKKLANCLKEGVDIEAAVKYATTNQATTPIEYQGKTYPTLTALANYLDRHIVTIQNRIVKGWPESLWDADDLPRTSPDFYFFLNNPEYDDGECGFYIVGLKNHEGYFKVGIAKSYTHRVDEEYGDLVVEMRYKTRFEAVVLEQSILHLTIKNAACPKVLEEREPRWHGYTEVRKVEQEVIDTLAFEMASEMEELGLEDFAIKYIPMSMEHVKLLAKICISLKV